MLRTARAVRRVPRGIRLAPDSSLALAPAAVCAGSAGPSTLRRAVEAGHSREAARILGNAMVAIILIAPTHVLPSLKARATDGTAELVLAFTDTDALLALDAIVEHRPLIVALERLFAATRRGAALIDRLKADPALSQSGIHIVSDHTDFASILQRAPVNGRAVMAVAPASGPDPDQPLDARGTRRSRRYVMKGTLEGLIDGNAARVVNLSTDGAQVISSTIFKPNQRVRMTLSDETEVVRLTAKVAWAAFEIPPNTAPHYRAGLEFIDGDASAIRAGVRERQPSARLPSGHFHVDHRLEIPTLFRDIRTIC